VGARCGAQDAKNLPADTTWPLKRRTGKLYTRQGDRRSPIKCTRREGGEKKWKAGSAIRSGKSRQTDAGNYRNLITGPFHWRPKPLKKLARGRRAVGTARRKVYLAGGQTTRRKARCGGEGQSGERKTEKNRVGHHWR